MRRKSRTKDDDEDEHDLVGLSAGRVVWRMRGLLILRHE
ncbi:MAG: hypothetical protein K0Q55_940 [Verrucomicrobia bacterium]|nr:hypothetical protein [Verrucomicrobiota bacterium]